MRWLESFDEAQRRVLIFGFLYQEIRQDREHFGYILFDQEPLPEVVETKLFKHIHTIVKWLDLHGWKVTWSEFHWQGFLEFAFRWMSPVVPVPGQLKNNWMLREYIKSQPFEPKEPVGRYTRPELEALYARKLRPDIRERGALLAALRLRQL